MIMMDYIQCLGMQKGYECNLIAFALDRMVVLLNFTCRTVCLPYLGDASRMSFGECMCEVIH